MVATPPDRHGGRCRPRSHHRSRRPSRVLAASFRRARAGRLRIGVGRIVAVAYRGAIAREVGDRVRRGFGIAVRVVTVLIFVLIILVVHQIRRMQERTLLGPNVHERCLDTRQYRFDLPDVDIADHAPGFRPIDEQLSELVVLQYGDPRLARVRVDQYFALHLTPQENESPPLALRRGGCGHSAAMM